MTRRGAQRPRLSAFPRARCSSAGPDAVEYAESLGYDLYDWQQWCLDGIFSEDADHRLCATLCLILMPRQNGKNIVLEVAELYAFFILDWPVILHSAHRADTAADHMARLRATIEANPDLEAITQIVIANGKEKIVRTDTRAEIRFVTRSKKIGRGKSPRMVVFDEALYLTDDQIQAMLPSMSAQSMSDDAPLMIYTSSAPVAESVVLHRMRDAFTSGNANGFYAEWSCLPTVDPLDVDAWYEANPSLGARISEAWVREQEVTILDAEAFKVERLGVPVLPPSHEAPPPVLPADLWRAAETRRLPDRVPGELTFGFDIHNGWSSIAVAQGSLTSSHVELVEHKAGDGWLPGRLVDLALTWKPKWIALDGGNGLAVAALGVVREAFDAAGLDPDVVRPLTTGAYKEACGGFLRAVQERSLTRPQVDADQLGIAGLSASDRAIGGAWVWNRKSATVPISPLVAATVARSLLGEKPSAPQIWAAWE